MTDHQNARVYGVVIAFLLLLSAGMGYFLWQKSRDYVQETERLEAEKKQLEVDKITIQHALDSLASSYADLRTENETLSGKLNSTAALVQQKDAIIRQIKSTSANDLSELRGQVATLEKTKIEYETIITALKGENEALKAEIARLADENAGLKGSNTQLTTQVEGLAKQLAEQIRKTQSATFKATSFRVISTRNRDKLTAKAKRVRAIAVSFDLADVPEVYQGSQKLYMVITDEKGTPIACETPIKVTVHPPAGPLDITAQQEKNVLLKTLQRESFNYKFNDRLKAGAYVVAIYSDQGLLGVSSFKLS